MHKPAKKNRPHRRHTVPLASSYSMILESYTVGAIECATCQETATVAIQSTNSLTLSSDPSDRLYKNYESLISVAREALRALLENRDFLGYQLSHAKGLISDDQMDELAALYLRDIPFDKQSIAEKTAMLSWLIPDQVDADIIATIFRCDDTQAQAALEETTTKTNFPSANYRVLSLNNS